jgi:hypothetical protein
MWELCESDSNLPGLLKHDLYLRFSWLAAFIPIALVIIVNFLYEDKIHADMLLILSGILIEWMLMKYFAHRLFSGKISVAKFSGLNFAIRTSLGLPMTILIADYRIFSAVALFRLFFSVLLVFWISGKRNTFFYLSLFFAGMIFYSGFISGFSFYFVDFGRILFMFFFSIVFFAFIVYVHQGQKIIIKNKGVL